MSRNTTKKLRLQLEMLKVESVTAAEPRGERGTIRGNEGATEVDTCGRQYTCHESQNSCYPTCQQIETCQEFC